MKAKGLSVCVGIALGAIYLKKFFRIGKPTLIIAHTIKGKGIPWMEFDSLWHTHPLDEKQTKTALEDLARSYGRSD